jgi:cytochrome c553
MTGKWVSHQARLAVLAGFLAVVSLAGTVVNAATTDGQEERKRLLAHIQEVNSSPAERQQAADAGRRRSVLCSYCHGKDGNSLKPDIPNLAGQNPTYLLQQIEKFADGRRKNFVMQTLANDFTMADKVNLAVYFSRQTVKPVPVDPKLAEEGERIFDSVCKICHGLDGHGEKGYARLAGQKPEYVRITLKRFRANAQKKLRPDEVLRSDARMEQMTQHLSDADINALAAYIATLRPKVH